MKRVPLFHQNEKRKFVRYAMLLKSHANTRYQQSLHQLALIECQCILQTWGIHTTPEWLSVCGEPFLVFESEPLCEEAWADLSRHSAMCLAGTLEGEQLTIRARNVNHYVPAELPEILKYKGKTNADFTYMLLHCAKEVSAFAKSTTPLTVADPICGKGTTLFCALVCGDHAVGIEQDQKALAEADRYLQRFLKMNHLIHKRSANSLTLPRAKSAPLILYQMSKERQSAKAGEARQIRFIHGNTLQTGDLLGKESCHLMVGDLPYGVQHAPMQTQAVTSLDKLVQSAMPSYAKALKKGGAMAFAFNEFTLQRKTLMSAMQSAGLTVLNDAPFNGFSHWVEQAVQRDVVIAIK